MGYRSDRLRGLSQADGVIGNRNEGQIQSRAQRQQLLHTKCGLGMLSATPLERKKSMKQLPNAP